MNEIRFENRFVRDESTAKEIYGYWFFKKPLSVAIYIVLGFYSLSCIFGLTLDFQSAKETIPILAMIVFYVIIMIVSYRSQVKGMAQRDREMSGGGELCCEISVSDDEITLSTLESRNPVAMSNVKSAFMTKNYVVVLTKARLMFILKKDSFTKGDADSFIAFLTEKGIKISGKKN
ncbi:MAG: YcxB family protein [Clostridia bacterium]|nr:YcxB family protein [Clostridia bacterium]